MAKNKDKRIKSKNYVSEDQDEIRRFIIILAILIVIILAAYLLTRIFVTKDLFNKKGEEQIVTPGEVNYDITLIGSMLNINKEEYYVLIVDTSIPSSAYYTGLMATYNRNTNALPVYLADLNNELNKGYISDTANVDTSDLTKFRVKGPTLIKVKNGKISKSITSDADMVRELKYIPEEKSSED